MKQLQGFKFQLRPKGQQAGDMQRFAGTCRFVFNQSLALQYENHEVGNKYLPDVKMAAWLVEWKKAPEAKRLKEAPSQPLQQALKDLEHAYQNCFQKRAAFPRFKKRGQHDVLRYPQCVKFEQENRGLFLPKLGWIRYRNSREMSPKVKFSNHWEKVKNKAEKLHAQIKHIRRDYLHKISTTLSKNYVRIVIEGLKVANMSKSAAGRVSQPGRNVCARSGLNRSIFVQGFYELRR